MIENKYLNADDEQSDLSSLQKPPDCSSEFCMAEGFRPQSEQEKVQPQNLEEILQQTQQELQALKTDFNQRLADEISEKTLEVELYQDISRKIGYKLNYEDLFRSILEHLHTIVDYDVTGGILVEDRKCELFLKTNRPLSTIAQLAIEHQLLDNLAQVNGIEFIKHQICVHFLNPKIEKVEEAAISQIGSHFLVPIVGNPDENKIIGLLFVGTEQEKQFSERHIRLLCAIANQASISVQQLRLLIAAEQSRLENDKIRQALNKEKELNELKTRVIRTVSHEYRTPLTVITLAAELLETQFDRLNNEQKQSCFQQIRSATTHMIDLVNDVVLVDRAESNEIEFSPKKFNVSEFCYQLVNDFRLLANDNHRINFISQCDSISYLDRTLLKQILNNLLSNAIKYSPEGGIVDFHVICNQQEAIFSIQDSGIGIPVEDRDKLFDNFHRASNVGNLPGTGLGLAIVKKCVDLHQGQITVESEVGIGSKFTVRLPLKAEGK